MRVLHNLYYNLVYPYLIYCNVVWGGTYTANLNPLILLQKKIIRIISNEGYLAHTDPLFREQKILKIVDIHTYLIAITAFKINLCGGFTTIDHPYATRNRDNPVTPFNRLTICRRSVSFSAPHIWSKLPQNVRNCTSLNTFKKEMKNFLISSYADVV